MKQAIEVMDYASEILKAVPKGVLLTTKDGDKVNSMVIGWGTLGFEWARPIFTVFVRDGRFTNGILDKTGEFTISVPRGVMDANILRVCGTQSGRNVDKVAAAHLTLEEPEVIRVPGIRQVPLTLECKVIYKQHQDPQAIPEDIRTVSYPQDVDSSFHGANKDYHMAYYGLIVASYIIK